MMSGKQEPYLSIVVASRNDNHGGDMLKRMRIFLRGLIHQSNTHQLHCELIMVEWNPIKGQPLLNDVLPQPDKEDFLTVRYIQVPQELHDALAFSKQIPLFQMIAKNVGIRRASAKFVLCTNVDLLFSDDLFARLSKKDLQENSFYRANRCDVPNTIDEHWPVKQQLNFCQKNILLRLGKNNWYTNFSSTSGFLFRHRVFIPFLRALSKIKSTYATSAKDLMAELDLDACGDFTLMSKKDWIAIQGYAELEMYSIHIDSMGIIAAAASGMKQIVFPGNACTYHLQHTGGWEFKTPIDKLLFFTKKPMLDWSTVYEAGLYLLEHKTNFNINKSNWGFADVALHEISTPI